MVSPGLSSVPASIEPIITVSAPPARPLTMSPVKRMPPSAMTGTPVPRSASETSITAPSWGTPTPAITRVVQIEPGPMPTLTASAPASTKALAASAVAMLPQTTSMEGKAALTFFSVSSTPRLWPCAVSMMTASTPALTSASVRSMVSCVTPTAAATRKRPHWSLQELGKVLSLMMSR